MVGDLSGFILCLDTGILRHHEYTTCDLQNRHHARAIVVVKDGDHEPSKRQAALQEVTEKDGP
jgi:hypothetical protein